MDFAKIEKIIDELVAFVKSFAANLKKFIAGFKSDLEFNTPDAE